LAADPRLLREFFERETLDVARSLLGKLVVRVTEEGRAFGRIVETEAYLGPSDLASHAARLKSGRVQSMAGPAGIAYVYRSYGIHAMFNIVAKAGGLTGAVLVRALEPSEGIELMRRRRGLEDTRDLCSGPGKLCQAMAIRLSDHGSDLVTDAHFWIEAGPPPERIFAGERIGITRSVEHPWRFFDPDSPFVSVHRRGMPVVELPSSA
jgi:DNA-3-methyladenine glycosylase